MVRVLIVMVCARIYRKLGDRVARLVRVLSKVRCLNVAGKCGLVLRMWQQWA